MNGSGPKISIVMAVFNSAQTLQCSLDSVRAQTYPNTELIVIDGASTDGSVDIIRANSHLISYWESRPDRGIYHAWNKALDHVRGDWIHFLGADDYFMYPEVLAEVARELSGCPHDVKVAYGRCAMVSDSGRILQIRGDFWERSKRKLLKEMSLPHPALFTHRDVFAVHGRFDESFLIGGDYEHLLRELKDGKAVFMPEILVKGVRLGGVSTSPRQIVRFAIEIAWAKRRNGIFPYHPGWFWFLCKSWAKQNLHRQMGERATRRTIDSYRWLTGRPAIWTKM